MSLSKFSRNEEDGNLEFHEGRKRYQRRRRRFMTKRTKTEDTLQSQKILVY